MEENPAVSRKIMEKAVDAARARDAASAHGIWPGIKAL